MIEHSRLPRKQPAWATPYRSGEGKFRSRKNANRRVHIVGRGESCRTGIEVMGSKFLTDFGWA
jgi:hypothetical protein